MRFAAGRGFGRRRGNGNVGFTSFRISSDVGQHFRGRPRDLMHLCDAHVALPTHLSAHAHREATQRAGWAVVCSGEGRGVGVASGGKEDGTFE